ncbi:hypothetical protein GALMADRAFT_217152 [Galerina marginata CBS 339.88]|uniref:Uncharacterized protein n=1 Tax=Galerina marginata (strain CBS 339.88) TaxID=685588 RepID=A0A067S627_GALM3|nr:hypothetical protein GALMADRAFT_217152 [Galerina marginata CBS 339.88]
MPESWFSPYPKIQRGLPSAFEDLDNMDKEIGFLESILLDSKERRKLARSLPRPPIGEETERNSAYLTIVENQRRAEMELSKLRGERLKLILIAGLAFDPSVRGDYFPHPTVEDKAKEFIQMQNGRLLAVSTVAFFGIVVAYPGRRGGQIFATLLAAFFSFVGMVLMAVAVVRLDFRNEGNISNIDTRINPIWGGIASLLPVLLGFSYGFGNMIFHGIKTSKIRAQKSESGNP